MATILDTSMLDFLAPIFVFLLVFASIYAFLQKVKLFGENMGLNAVIAFAVSMLFMIVPEATGFVTLFTPWVMILGLFVLVIFLFFMFLGVKGETLIDVAKGGTFVTFMIIAFIIVFLIALSNVYGPFLLTNQQPGFWNATKRALFHPRVLGAIFILVVAAYAVNLISPSASK